jgi:hypothetical protein
MRDDDTSEMPRGCETNPREKEDPEMLFLYPSDDDEEGEEQAEILQTTGGVLRNEPNTVEAAAEHVCIVTAMVVMPKLLQNPHLSPNPLLSRKGRVWTLHQRPQQEQQIEPAGYSAGISACFFFFFK